MKHQHKRIYLCYNEKIKSHVHISSLFWNRLKITYAERYFLLINSKKSFDKGKIIIKEKIIFKIRIILIIEM